MTRPRVRMVHQLARTGGTLVNRCLGSMRSVVVLSEVHPFDPQRKIARQAAAWFGLLGPADMAWLQGPTRRNRMEAFAALVERVAERSAERGLHLVLRDWTHLDFLGVPFVADPPMLLSSERALRETCALEQAFLVRRPLDQYLSSASRPGMAPYLTPSGFMAAYHAFARLAAAGRFLRYEDLVTSPDHQLRLLCESLDLPFDPGYSSRWQRYDKLTGDNTGPSRGFAAAEIAPMPPRQAEPELREAFRRDPRYHESLALLGYAESDQEQETA